MNKGRITKLVCPACEGTGATNLFVGYACFWCRGAKRLPVADALRYADNTFSLAGGGYLGGDHDLDEMRRMEDRARKIYALAEVAPPWKAVLA